MNEKQAKLLRYYERGAKDPQVVALTKKLWHTLSHKQKGKLTTRLKKVIVTNLALQKLAKQKQLQANLDVLKGFAT